ncbi:uncharacterized protein JCM6883_002993 [Sporobolomyces salmoneus]|uniref:uncharacterized protein n=1 Tax=Sporobolomyces salmoneus TaxID=183962 RepID=UPI00317A6499
MAFGLPRKAVRAARYLVLALIVLALCYSRSCSPSSTLFNSSSYTSRPLNTALRRRQHTTDFAWGSIIHRFQNHPRPAKRRKELPWKREGKGTGAGSTVRALIVTSELAGLHKNGGIGTAFVELAEALGGEREIEISILVSHLEESFPLRKVERLRSEFEEKRIRLEFVEPEAQPFWPQAWTPTASLRVWNFLKHTDGDYDVVHFPDNTGIGYFTALGKHEGLALRQSRIVVGLHGADVEWAAMLNKRYPQDRYAVELGVFEQKTAEYADVVVAPSDYMLEYVRSRGWQLPESALVIPNIVKLPSSSLLSSSSPSAPINEIVFFGRLEERKGTRLLINTLETLYSSGRLSPSSLAKVTFLGRDQPDVKTQMEASALLGEALLSIKEHTNATFEYDFLTTFDRDEALAYLRGPGRLAVLPSLADNSPSTVLECISHGIRFVASDVGGVPELVHEADHDRVLFKPLISSFSDKLLLSLDSPPTSSLSPIRPSPSTQTAARDWINLHHWLAALPFASDPALSRSSPLVTICITHYERPHLISQLLDSLLLQTYSNFEVILVDDGSKSPAALTRLDELDSIYFHNSTLLANRPQWTSFRSDNSYLGEARNKAAAKAKGEWLLFLDDDDVLKPHALKTLVDVASRTQASALSTWLDEFATDINPLAPRTSTEELPHRRTYWFLGQELGAGLLLNCFGSGNIFVTRLAFDNIGGFSTYREVGGEDWEFYTRLALSGKKQLVVPEELIFVRSDPSRDSMKFSMDPWDAHFHSLVPLLNDDRIQDLRLPHALMMLKGVVTREATPSTFADSQEDFQLVQGWSGWTYSFEPVETVAKDTEDRLGVVSGDSFVLDRNSPLKPYINDGSQEGWVTSNGERIAAVRTFKSPKTMDVAVDLSYRSHHRCGDGTHLVLSSVGGPGEEPQELVRFDTVEESFAEYRGHVSLRPGSTIHLSSDPLETDECDRVEVRLAVTPIVLENKSWSALARKAEIQREEARKASLVEKKSETVQWHSVKQEHVEEGDVFNIALIFDRNRYPHAKQVIRSAQHYVTPRPLVFHLITPKELHEDLEQFFAGTPMSLRLYDHELCKFVAQRILPFSDPGIHVSAHCKMFLSDILTYADRVLYLDTDTTITSDISTCYFAPKKSTTLVSMSVDMGDICQRNPDRCWPIGLHWRVPDDLECGNVPARASGSSNSASCAQPGELETIQVNGGVALFELGKMREQGFVERYVQSIIHHYRVVGRPATWGEQDFINSYFRLFPKDLELLPCGCNYQWFGTRREVKCGEQPVMIAHHWSHGIAGRTQEPYNQLFHHFLDAPSHSSVASSPPPSIALPTLSYSSPGAPNSSSIDLIHTLNCPRQNHDCSLRFEPTEYGQPVAIVSRILSETFASDLVDSLESQTYPNITQAIALCPGADVPSTSFDRGEFELLGSVEEDYEEMCARCGELTEGNECTMAPRDPEKRRKYFDCVCSSPDTTASVMYELEAFGSQSEGWILYLDDDKTFISPTSLSLLMAEVGSPEELVVFRSNTTSGFEEEIDFRQKILSKSTMDGIGFVFHSSHLPLTQWNSKTRCGKWATFTSLASVLRMRWIDLVPTMTHPLQRHLPQTLADDFKVTVIVLETEGRTSWTSALLDRLQEPELLTLVAEVVVASIDKTETDYPDLEGIKVINPSSGSGLSELGEIVETESVLLISDNVYLDKAALTSLITFHLDEPSRLHGFFAPLSPDSFNPPLEMSSELFDIFEEPDLFVDSATKNYSHLLPRALLTSRSSLQNLSSILDTSEEEPLHPICHPILLTALSIQESGFAPLIVLPPERSIVDRIHDCRIRSWSDVGFGLGAGDIYDPSIEKGDNGSEGRSMREEGELGGADVENAEEDEVDFEHLTDEELQAIIDEEARQLEDQPKLSKRSSPDEAQADFVEIPISSKRFASNSKTPTLGICIKQVSTLLGGSSQWTKILGTEIGVSGPLGIKKGIVRSEEVGKDRWERSRRIEGCLR